MNNGSCVLAEFSIYTQKFSSGGYVAIGWMANTDLAASAARDDLNLLQGAAHPDDTREKALEGAPR